MLSYHVGPKCTFTNHLLTFTRLNKIYRESVNEEEILGLLRPLIKSYALERMSGEHFGDFCVRTGVISATKSGKQFYEDSSPGVMEITA